MGAGGIPSAVVRLFVTVSHVPPGTPGNNEKFAAYASRLRVFECNQPLAPAATSQNFSRQYFTSLRDTLKR